MTDLIEHGSNATAARRYVKALGRFCEMCAPVWATYIREAKANRTAYGRRQPERDEPAPPTLPPEPDDVCVRCGAELTIHLVRGWVDPAGRNRCPDAHRHRPSYHPAKVDG